MATTPDLGLPELAESQATPHVTFNEAMILVEALSKGVISQTNTPPGSPAEGDSYLVGTAPTGVWSTKANTIAMYTSGGWRYVPGNDDSGTQITMGANQEGMRVWRNDTNALYYWDSAAWTAFSAPGDAANITFSPDSNGNWTGATDPGDVDDALNQLAERMSAAEASAGDAADVTYTPADPTDWDSSTDPGDVAEGLDQLANRVNALEDTPPGTPDASAVTFTPADLSNWGGSDPGSTADALDYLANSGGGGGGGPVDASAVTYTPDSNGDWGGSDPGDVDDALNQLASRTAFTGAMVKKSVDQTGANYTSATVLTWDAEVYDVGGLHSTSVDTHLLTIPAGGDGYWQVVGNIRIVNQTADTWVALTIQKNGSGTFDGAAAQFAEFGTTTPCVSVCSGPIPAVAGDTFNLLLQVESDTSIDIVASRSNFSIHKVG